MVRGRLLVLVLLAGLLLFGGSVGYAFWANGRKIDALCKVVRPDKERSLAASQRYLKAHPNGAPGIPARLIREGIRDTQQTLRDLDSVGCHSTTTGGTP